MSTDATPRPRLAWVDAARGISILLVVALHTHGLLAPHLLSDPALTKVNLTLATLRMPTFFLVSGLLFAGALRRGATGTVGRRAALLAYLFLLWSGIYVVAHAAIAAVAGRPVGASVEDDLRELVTVSGVLWYLLALAAFFLLARLTARVPVALQLGVAALVSVLNVTEVLHASSWGVDHMVRNYVFFLAGAHLEPAARAFAAAVTPARCAGLVALWLGGAVVALELDDSGHLLLAVAPWIGVLATVALAAVVADHVAAAPLRRLGANTLPVYVLHPLVLAVIGAALTRIALPELPSPALQLAALVPATLVVAAIAWASWRALRWVPWLFALPAWPRAVIAARSGAAA